MSVKAGKPRLLIVEDDAGLSDQLEWAFTAYDVKVAGNRRAALALLKTHNPAVITLDLGLPPDPDGTSEGFATLQEITIAAPNARIIVASGHEARESAQQAIALGAFDFYAKPINITELGMIVARAFHVHQLEAETREQAQVAVPSAGIITASPVMAEVLRTIEKVAASDATVMLLGASGTGKELLAKAIHTKSARVRGEFIAINCAAIPDTLLEAELFGHERGAFTGAIKTTPGQIEMAQGGTLFLDEIGDVPAATQVKLLRFLQERVIERVGGRKKIPIDARVVTATHQDLKQAMADGRFREDLYFRLAEVVVNVPPLSQRGEDSVLLAQFFLGKQRENGRTKARGFTPEALTAILNWPWTGNVRELENRVKRATILADGVMLTPRDLDLDQDSPASESLELRIARERADRAAITNAIAVHQGNLSAAARALDISRPLLYQLLATYGIPKG